MIGRHLLSGIVVYWHIYQISGERLKDNWLACMKVQEELLHSPWCWALVQYKVFKKSVDRSLPGVRYRSEVICCTGLKL